MYRDVEDVLVRELRQVADGVEVPVLPPLPADAGRRSVWPPLLVAAAVLLVILGAVAAVRVLGDDADLQPAPSPSPSVPTEEAPETGPLSTEPPRVPYILGNRLYVDGQQVPGEWWTVQGTGTRWVASAAGPDGGYWWGYDAEPQRIEGQLNQPPSLSPNGRYQASVLDDGQGTLVGADTDPGGEGFGGVPVAAESGGVYTRVSAVTDDGLVIATGNRISLLWRPLVDGKTVDLTETAPGWVVVDNTAAGVVVEDAAGERYLAEISADGEITPLQQVPDQNEGGPVASTQWLVWPDPEAVGGEVTGVAELQVQRVGGEDVTTVSPPRGWEFAVETWTWEDDDHLVARVVDGRDREQMTRCSPVSGECVLLETP